MTRARRLGLVAAVALVLPALVAACADSSTTSAPPSMDPSFSVDYAPGLSVDVYLPEEKGPVPLVVLVPGGSWTTADPTGLAGLAAGLAEASVASAPTQVRAAEDDVVYPTPVEDVLCAVAAAVAETTARGYTPGPVAVLGHSSGAHLAALAVLAVDDYSPSCSSPAVRPDALIGLSGPYDISQLADVASALLGTGPGDDPEAWEAANPVERAGLRPEVPVLLRHGEDDEVVSVGFTTQFAAALEDAGHPTTVQLVPGVDHLGIFAAEVSGEPIAQWLLALPPRG